MALYFRNPQNGFVEKAYGTWSFLWAFLFGPIYFLVRGAWPAALALIAVGLFLFTRGDIVELILMVLVQLGFAMASRAIIRRTYLRKGWIETDPQSRGGAEPRAEPAFWSTDRRA